MAVPYSNTSLRVPPGFQGLLEGLVREVLLTQPKDIYGFAAVYFENMLEIREDGNEDAASRVMKFNDRLYNNKAIVISGAHEDTQVPAEAAVTIQTKYRQFQAKSVADEKRQDNAAVKIQSSARGFVARKRVKRIRASTERNNMEQAAAVDDIDDDVDKELQDLMGNEELMSAEMLPSSIYSGVAKPDDEMINAVPPQPVEEVVDIDLADPEVQKAAAFIQSGFKGFKAKKFAASKVAKPSVGVNTDKADVDLTNPGIQSDISVIQATLGAVMTNLTATDQSNETVDLEGVKELQLNDLEDGTTKEEDNLPDVDMSGEEDGKNDLEVPNDAPTEYVEEDQEEADSTITVDEAVSTIQAAFRGMQLRREIASAGQVLPDEGEVIEETSTGAGVTDE